MMCDCIIFSRISDSTSIMMIMISFSMIIVVLKCIRRISLDDLLEKPIFYKTYIIRNVS